jgi:hypothetical protein
MLLRAVAVRVPVYLCLIFFSAWSYQRGRLSETEAELARIKLGVDRAAMRVAANVVSTFRGELLETGLWLHHFYQADEGLGRPHGLARDGTPDFEGLIGWGIEIYLRERGTGATPEAARAAIAAGIRASPEWRALHSVR